MTVRYCFSDMIRHMRGSLRLRWSTTLAMISGIGIGLSILFISLAFASIVYSQAKKSQNATLINRMIVGVNEANTAERLLTKKHLDGLKAMPGIEDALPLIEISAEMELVVNGRPADRGQRTHWQ